MINSVDIVAILFLLYIAVMGWQKGIIRLLIGFLSFFLSGVIAGLYFTQTARILPALFIAGIGLIVFSLLLTKGLNLWNKKNNADKPPTPLSRFLGAGLSCAWMAVLIGLIVFTLSILPTNVPLFTSAKQAALDSSYYGLIEMFIIKKSPAVENLSLIASLSEEDQSALELSPERVEAIKSSPEFQAVLENEKIQEILQDEDLIEKIQNRDISAMLSDPRFYALLQDQELMEHLKQMYMQLLGTELLRDQPLAD